METSVYQTSIEDFLNNDMRLLKIPRIPLSVYVEIFKNKGFTYEFDSNGYQADFWVYFRKNNKTLILSGDLWYTESWTLTKEGIE